MAAARWRHHDVYLVLLASGRIPLPESKSVEVGIPENEPQADRFAYHLSHRANALPTNHPLQVVTEDGTAVRESITIQRSAGLILDLDPDVPRCRGRKVHHQILSLESQWLGDELASPQGSSHRGEPIDAQGVASQLAAGSGPVAFRCVHRQFVGCTLDR